jgi:hypothetical protein
MVELQVLLSILAQLASDLNLCCESAVAGIYVVTMMPHMHILWIHCAEQKRDDQSKKHCFLCTYTVYRKACGMKLITG